MKRLFLFSFLLLAVTGLPVTASHALDPGCSQQMMNLLEHQANATRSRNRGYQREIINRQPSTLYLTCFDQALALSARLGYIFSDVVDPAPPPANTVAFSGGSDKPPIQAFYHLEYAGWGAQHLLAINLDKVISPVLDDKMQNFKAPLWEDPNALTQLVDKLQPFLEKIQNRMDIQYAGTIGAKKNPPAYGDPEGQSTYLRYIKMVVKIDKLVDSLPKLSWSALPAAAKEYNTLRGDEDHMLKWLIEKLEENRVKSFTDPLENMKKVIYNAHISCTRMDDLWNKHVGGSGYFPPEGEYFRLSPYYTMEEVLKPPRTPAGAMADFEAELAADSGILNQAWSDLNGVMSSPQPGSPVWPAPPNFNADIDSSLRVIQQM